jgi:hypothetical protein
MKKIRIAVSVGGAMMALLAVALLAGHGRVAAAGDISSGENARVLRTAPTLSGTTREEMSRNYRSCLFSFLPQVGSDVAAEMIRDACRDEYLHPEK